MAYSEAEKILDFLSTLERPYNEHYEYGPYRVLGSIQPEHHWQFGAVRLVALEVNGQENFALFQTECPPDRVREEFIERIIWKTPVHGFVHPLATLQERLDTLYQSIH